uniref:[Ribosomal protein bS18]-alanine N-acetyltransferase n=1 Tax=uncultured Thiotrichaceae bacterium TaxID=298394 RepID=A0A6S6TN89_9GAMM|nr:MAG: Ribosomal-protein-S18p-alanine acetyltransferase (EC [uncultured Thiotrichaceae bacterium]
MHNTKQLLNLRPITEDDLDQIMEIELRAYPYPWARKNFTDCLKHNYHCLLHERDKTIIAYGVISAAVEEMHILNLTVEPKQQNQGLGKQLIHTLETVGRGLDAKECFLEVRPSNVSAIRLYQNHGFNEVGLRKDYYPAKKGREHAVVMAKVLL